MGPPLSRAGRGLGRLCCRVPYAIGVSLFQFYGYLSQQQNMMQDYVRTGTYQRAILQNHTDFKDKVSGTCPASPSSPSHPFPQASRAPHRGRCLSLLPLLMDFIFNFFRLQKQNALTVKTQPSMYKYRHERSPSFPSETTTARCFPRMYRHTCFRVL